MGSNDIVANAKGQTRRRVKRQTVKRRTVKNATKGQTITVIVRRTGEQGLSDNLFCNNLSKLITYITDCYLCRLYWSITDCYLFRLDITPVQPATPVGIIVQIKQLIVVPDRVLCTRYFVL